MFKIRDGMLYYKKFMGAASYTVPLSGYISINEFQRIAGLWRDLEKLYEN